MVRRPRAAVESEQRRRSGAEIADHPIPRAVAAVVNVALRRRRGHRGDDIDLAVSAFEIAKASSMFPFGLW
jgi:hypothetical protein